MLHSPQRATSAKRVHLSEGAIEGTSQSETKNRISQGILSVRLRISVKESSPFFLVVYFQHIFRRTHTTRVGICWGSTQATASRRGQWQRPDGSFRNKNVTGKAKNMYCHRTATRITRRRGVRVMCGHLPFFCSFLYYDMVLLFFLHFFLLRLPLLFLL